MTRFPLLAVSLVAFFFAGSSAQALSITVGGAGCGSCDGSEFTLEIVETASGYDATLTLDSTNYDESRDGVAQMGFGAISGWTSVSLVSSPTSSIAWSDPVHSNISSSSLCGGTNGNSGKVCTWGFTDIQDDGEYIWEFEVTGGKLKMDTAEWHIGGQYANESALTNSRARGPNGKIISESGAAPVPEPTAALVFGVGVVVFSRKLRRAA